MLRLVLGHGRRKAASDHDGKNEVLEPWVDWVRRVTHEAEAKLEDMSIESGVTSQRRSKWIWATKLAGMDQTRWALIATKSRKLAPEEL